MDIICKYNNKANLYSFYCKTVDRTFTVTSKGNRNPALGDHCLKWELSRFPELDENIPQAAYLAAREFFSELLAKEEAPSLMVAWKKVTSS